METLQRTKNNMSNQRKFSALIILQFEGGKLKGMRVVLPGFNMCNHTTVIKRVQK